MHTCNEGTSCRNRSASIEACGACNTHNTATLSVLCMSVHLFWRSAWRQDYECPGMCHATVTNTARSIISPLLLPPLTTIFQGLHLEYRTPVSYSYYRRWVGISCNRRFFTCCFYFLRPPLQARAAPVAGGGVPNRMAESERSFMNCDDESIFGARLDSDAGM